MKLYNVQHFLDANGWTPRDFTDNKDWIKEVNNRSWSCRIHYTMVNGYYGEFCEVYFKHGSPYLKTGKYKYAMSEPDLQTMNDIIDHLTENETI